MEPGCCNVSKELDDLASADSSSDLSLKCDQFFAKLTSLSTSMSAGLLPSDSLNRDEDCGQTSLHCRCPHSSSDRLSPVHNPHGEQDLQASAASLETFMADEGDEASAPRRSSVACHRRPRRQGGETVWACVARSGFVVVVLMSCLGVNWARPAGLPAALSDHEKHYRDLQSKAVVSVDMCGKPQV
ncbi:hypothetical protein ACOMHN_051785 [Nucella lapillus]